MATTHEFDASFEHLAALDSREGHLGTHQDWAELAEWEAQQEQAAEQAAA